MTTSRVTIRKLAMPHFRQRPNGSRPHVKGYVRGHVDGHMVSCRQGSGWDCECPDLDCTHPDELAAIIDPEILALIDPDEGPEDTDPAAGQKSEGLTQADVDRIVKGRVERERAKFADYEELKAKATQLDELKAQAPDLPQALNAVTSQVFANWRDQHTDTPNETEHTNG